MNYNDNYLNYSIVIESSTPEEYRKPQIIEHRESTTRDGLNFLRFLTCLQSFRGRNRNRRLWTDLIIKSMLAAAHILELIKVGWPGENGHPVPIVGQPTLERILTIDPNNMSHKINSINWRGDLLYGEIETLDEGLGSPGVRFMRNILQNIDPSFSLRSIVPQRKNADGSIDVTGPGRLVTYDRVILPSHMEAYIDKNIPIKNIITKTQFEMVMESMTEFILEKSNKVNKIIDGMSPAMESASLDKTGHLSIPTAEGLIIVAPENKYRREIADIMTSFH